MSSIIFIIFLNYYFTILKDIIISNIIILFLFHTFTVISTVISIIYNYHPFGLVIVMTVPPTLPFTNMSRIML